MSGFLNENTRELSESSPIAVKELPKDRMQLMRALKMDPDYAHDGAMGYIVTCRTSQKRLHSDIIRKMAKSKIFRWIEIHPDNQISIGC